MAYIIPESITRLQLTAFVSDAELCRVGQTAIIRAQAEKMAEQALRKILDDCITTDDYMGYQGQTLRLDVVVLSHQELLSMLEEARVQGEKDAAKWSRSHDF